MKNLTDKKMSSVFWSCYEKIYINLETNYRVLDTLDVIADRKQVLLDQIWPLDDEYNEEFSDAHGQQVSSYVASSAEY